MSGKRPNTVCSGQRLRRSGYAPRASQVVFGRRRLARAAAAAKTCRWAEVPKNLEFAADVLMAGDKALSRYLERVKGQDTQFWQDFWNKLPEEEKWKVRVATYNSGQGCVGEAIFATGGQATSWEQIAKQLGTDCIQADDEVNDVWDYLP